MIGGKGLHRKEPTMRAIQIWGTAFIVLGIVFLIQIGMDINEPFVSHLIVIGALLVGHLLPLPEGIANRLRRRGLATKIVIIIVGLAVYSLVMLGLHELTGLDLGYAGALVFLALGLILVLIVQLRRPRSAASEESA